MRITKGFTAVELLVAMVIGALLLGSAYQLYATVVRDAGAAQQRSIASSYAYTLLRQYQKNSALVTSPCSTSTNTPTIPSSVGISPQSSATVAITCPYSTITGVSLITVTVTYFTPNQESVVRAIVVQP